MGEQQVGVVDCKATFVIPLRVQAISQQTEAGHVNRGYVNSAVLLISVNQVSKEKHAFGT